VPLVLVPDDDRSLLGILIGGLFRVLWRHRSALAPLALSAVVFCTAVWLHTAHQPWWLPIGAVTVAVGGFLAGAPARRWPWLARVVPVLGRLAERIYATACVTVTGGWLSAATALGVTTKPLPLLWLIGTGVCCVPWWAHRRRRAKVRVERTLEAWPDIAEAVGLKGSRIMSATVDRWGFTARLGLRKGQTAKQAIDAIPALESGLGTRPGGVRVEPDPDRADHALMRVVNTDPHAHSIPYPPMGDGQASITRPVPLGLFEDGTPAAVMILRRNVLVGGVTDSGKSGVVNTILAWLVACPDVVVWGIDLKRGMELGPWLRCLDRLATTPAEAVALLRDAVGELDARGDEEAARGERLWQPTPERPALVLVVDEYAELPPEAAPLADSIARRGRAVAVNLLVATQRPTQKAMGQGAVRSQMDVRIALRVVERRDAELILTEGAVVAGWQPQRLDAPGKFLIRAPEHTTPKRARAYLITDAEVSATARRHAGNRPTLATRTNRPADPDNPIPERNTEDDGNSDRQAPRIPRQREPFHDQSTPEGVLWRALRTAPAEGLPIGDLISITRKYRTWVYDQLQHHNTAGRVTQVSRGRWRATPPYHDPGTDPGTGTGTDPGAGPGHGPDRDDSGA
jgi:S-DNA-T family DNA segregation ATPase FtsK/SpoIIIE